MKALIFRHLFCKLLGHKLHIVKKITNHITIYECMGCKTQFTTTSKGYIKENNKDTGTINSTLEAYYKKKEYIKQKRSEKALKKASKG